MALPIQGMAALVNGVIKAVIHQDEALDLTRSKTTPTTPSTRRRKSRRRIRSRFDAERNSTPADRRRSRRSRVYTTYTSRHCTTSTLIRSMEST